MNKFPKHTIPDWADEAACPACGRAAERVTAPAPPRQSGFAVYNDVTCYLLGRASAELPRADFEDLADIVEIKLRLLTDRAA